MIQSTTNQQTRSSKAHREALRHLADVFSNDAPFSVSIDGLPECEFENQKARQILIQAFERAIQIEITDISIDQADAGQVTPIEDIESVLQDEQDV